MKKQIISLIALFLCCAISAFAQSPLVATLSHNDTVSVFYGRSALKNAYDVSVHGDVITLSSGTFNVPSAITKKITIRGSGMERDTIKNIYPTTLYGDFSIFEESDTIEGRFLMDGICHIGLLELGYNGSLNGFAHTWNAPHGAQFVKCRFEKIYGYSETGYARGAKWDDVVFTQCKVTEYLTFPYEGSPKFINCIILEAGTSSIDSYYLQCEFTNCVLINHYLGYAKSAFDFYNCVFWGANDLSSNSAAYQCVANYTGTSLNGMFGKLIGDIPNVSLSDSTALFKTFRGTYNEKETFELTDSAKEKYLGTDGTQVGVYGGTLPFNPQVTMPQIKKFKVAPKSTGDGKLSVEIEVGAAE